MTNFSRKDIFINNLKLHSEAFGKHSNPACILIAGKMSTARFWSNTFCQYLAKAGFLVIRYDHRDVGESSEIDWQKEPYTMSDLARDTILILDGYGIKKAHFAGDSMGGWICQRIGVDYPERVLSLVIISAGPIEITKEGLMTLTAEEKELLDSMSKIFLSFKEGKTLNETVNNLLSIWRYSNGNILFDEDMAKAFTIDFMTRTKNKNAKNHDLMMQKFLSEMKMSNTLKQIDKPTLIIHGDRDPVVLPRHGKAVADAISNSKLVMIEGMGHVFFNRVLEEKIAQLIIDFLKKFSERDTKTCKKKI